MTDDARSPEPSGDEPKPLAAAGDDASPKPDETPASEASKPEPLKAEAPEAPKAPDVEAPKVGAPLVVSPAPFRPNYVFFAVVSILSLGADLGSKGWAKATLQDPETLARHSRQVIRHYLSMRLAENPGGAWGLLQEQPEQVRRWFFLGVSLLAVVFIVSLYRKLTAPQWALKWGLPLVLGGALGNLVNRIQYNHVIDFIDAFYIGGDGREHHWPTFNVADIAIVVGVALMAIDMFTSRRPAKPKDAAGPGPEAPIGPPSSAKVEAPVSAES